MRRFILPLLAVLSVLLASMAVGQEPADERIYPRGRQFPLLLYSIHTLEEMEQAKEAGWNTAHRYNFSEEFLELVAQADGWHALAHLPGMTDEPLADADTQTAVNRENTESAANPEEAGETGTRIEKRPQTEHEAAAVIKDLAAHDALAWWDLPEELRYWREDEYDLVKNLSAWTRKYDPQKRPNYMYQPGHSGAERVAKYVPYLDIIGCGTYTEYAHQPRAWVRWRTEETIRGIKMAGHDIGPDYLNGERVPIGIPMLFYSSDHRFDVITPAEAYHDFWSCIASGAKGIMVFSYWHQRDLEILKTTWERGYNRAAANLSGGGDLDQAILFGETVALDVEITEGSPRTASFRPYGVEEDVSFPSINVLARVYQDTLYIISVSSRERPVTARISGLPGGIDDVEVMFEQRSEDRGGNTIPVGDGSFEDAYPYLTVHVYRTDMP